jgi:spore maturation protein CgeB
MAKEKIIIIGSNHEAALELIFVRELEKLGFSVLLYPAQNIFFEYYYKSVFNKLLYRLGYRSIISKIQKSIKDLILKEHPDKVLVFKGMEVAPQTLQWIRLKGIQLLNYNPDHPFVFSGRGSGNNNVLNSVKLFDCYFSYDRQTVLELKKRGVYSYELPFGFDHNAFHPGDFEKDTEVLKVCFLGNADKPRVRFINNLAEKGIEIDVYGENWSQFKLNQSIGIYGPKYGIEFWRTLHRYPLQLNLLRVHNHSSHNMRTFDVPGAAAIMLAPRTQDHLSFFEENNEIFLFSDVNEAYDKIKYVFSLKNEERYAIRSRARLKALQKHTYEQRVAEFVQICRNL